MKQTNNKKMTKERPETNHLEPVVLAPKTGDVSMEKTRLWLIKELEHRITVDRDLEKLIFIGVTNRTNTGALATAIGRAPTNPPITRHIQPIKAIARRLVSEQKGIDPSTPLVFLKDKLELGKGFNLVKETIGPNSDNPAEWMDALTLFLNKGIDPKKMCFIPTFRDPIDVTSSWKRMWKWEWIDFPFDSLNHSFETTLLLLRKSKDLGINAVPYVHEFLRDFGPQNVIERMFTKIELPFSRRVVNWDNPNTKSDDTTDWYFDGNIIKYDSPPSDWIEGALSVAHGGRGELRWEASKLQLTSEELEFVVPKIQRSIEIYKQVASETRKQLGLGVE